MSEKQEGYQLSEEELEQSKETIVTEKNEDAEKSGNFELLFTHWAMLKKTALERNWEIEINQRVTNQKIEDMLRGLIDTDRLSSYTKEMQSNSPEEIGKRKRSAASEITQALLANKDQLTERREEKAHQRRARFNERSYKHRFNELQEGFREGKYTIEASFFNVSINPFEPISNYSDGNDQGHYENDTEIGNPRIVLKDEEGWKKSGFLYFEEIVEIENQLSPETKHMVDLLIAGAFVEYLEYRKGKAQEEIETLQAVFNNKLAKEKSIVDMTDGLLQRSGVESAEKLN